MRRVQRERDPRKTLLETALERLPRAPHTFCGVRDRALLEVFYCAGAPRVPDWLSVTLGDLDLEERFIVFGGRKLPLSTTAVTALREYLKRHPRIPTTLWLCEGAKRPLTYNAWARLHTHIGIPMGEYREDFIRRMAASGCSLETIRTWLGHRTCLLNMKVIWRQKGLIPGCYNGGRLPEVL